MAKKIVKLEVGDRVELTDGRWGTVVFDITTTPLIVQMLDDKGLMRVSSEDIARFEKAKEDASA